MTTIVTNREEMSCDLQFTNGATAYKGKTKIWTFDPHEMHYPLCRFMVGMAGTADEMIQIADFFSDPESWPKAPKIRNTNLLILTESKQVYMAQGMGAWVELTDKFTGIGSGRDAALGAMLAGASTKEAVKAASKVDIYTGMGVKTFNFN